jgi:hypothetical protein
LVSTVVATHKHMNPSRSHLAKCSDAIEQNHDIPDPSTETSWSSRLASTLVMPPRARTASETALTQASHTMGTAKTVCAV